MRDRFRFRAWQKNYQKMYYDVEMTYDYPCEPRGAEQSSFGDVLENDEYILMQCTGLKDKNGKLIYEEDILKQPDGIIDYVYWSDGCYIHNGTAITNYDICYQGDTWAKEVNTHEVIGNRYQNPELLED